MMEQDLEKNFDFCKNVDIHMKKDDIGNLVAIASEHGFRGIVVDPTRISELSKQLKSIRI